MPAVLRQQTRIEYKKPSRFNSVSVMLLLLLGVVGYIGYYTWPIMATRSNVKAELLDALPLVWRFNLRPPEVAEPELLHIRKDLYDKIHKLGVRDQKLEVKLVRTKKEVAIEANYTLEVQFPWPKKPIAIPCTTRVETDAAHIEW